MTSCCFPLPLSEVFVSSVSEGLGAADFWWKINSMEWFSARRHSQESGLWTAGREHPDHIKVMYGGAAIDFPSTYGLSLNWMTQKRRPQMAQSWSHLRSYQSNDGKGLKPKQLSTNVIWRMCVFVCVGPVLLYLVNYWRRMGLMGTKTPS